MKRFLIYSVILISTVFASISCIDLDEEYEENLKEQEKYYAKLQEQFGKDTVIIEKYLADSSLTAVKILPVFIILLKQQVKIYIPMTTQ
jgi:hypothetical protein